MARLDNKDTVASTGALKKQTDFQNGLKAHFTRLVVRIIFSGFVGMITAQRVLATDFTTTVTAPKNGTLTLNPGDTVTTTRGNGIVANGKKSVLNAPGVTVTTSGVNGFGAVAVNGGMLSITDGSKITTSGNGALGLVSNANGTGSTLMASSVTVTTSGINSFGALTEDGGQLTIDKSTITTTARIRQKRARVVRMAKRYRRPRMEPSACCKNRLRRPPRAINSLGYENTIIDSDRHFDI